MVPVIRTNRVRGLWNDPFDAMQREFDQTLGRIFSDGGQAAEFGRYPVDIHEDDGHVFVEAEMPGFAKDEVDVTLEAGVLTITGERKVEPKSSGTQHLSERRYTRIQRSFTLPTSVDESKVEAQLADGVLNVRLTKREELKPRKIAIRKPPHAAAARRPHTVCLPTPRPVPLRCGAGFF